MPTQDDPPRDPRVVVRGAELQVSSPEKVRTWLEARAENLDRSAVWGDKDIERALLERGDPLINISLARYGAMSETLQSLLAQAGENKALRLAALMNEVAAQANFMGTPSVLTKGRDSLGPLVAGLDVEEVTALFLNSAISEKFLIDFFEGKEPWTCLDSTRQLAAINALRQNPRMKARYQGPMDGYAEYRHEEVFSSCWELAAKVPADIHWASQLAWLYDATRPVARAIKNPLHLASRWVPDPTDQERLELEQKDLEKGQLGLFALMRKQIGRLALSAARSDEARRLIEIHEDVAIRCAFYSDASMSPDQMKAANERDFLFAFDQMMGNPSVWRTEAQRKILHDMAWDNKRDPQNRLDPQNMFNAMCDHYKQKYPDWFKSEELAEAGEPETKPVNVGDLNAAIAGIKGDLFTNMDLGRSTYQAVTKLLTRTAWLAWGLVVVLVILLFRPR